MFKVKRFFLMLLLILSVLSIVILLSPLSRSAPTAYAQSYPLAGNQPTGSVTRTGMGRLAATNFDSSTGTTLLNRPSWMPTATSTSTSISTVTTALPATATATQIPVPDLTITNVNPGSSPFHVGDSVTNIIQVANDTGSGSVVIPGSFTISDAMSIGIDSIVAQGTNWNFSISNTTSPAQIIAAYTGPYPIPSGTMLPVIMVTGKLNTNAIPSFVNTASINDRALGISPEGMDADVATSTISVQKAETYKGYGPGNSSNNRTSNITNYYYYYYGAGSGNATPGTAPVSPGLPATGGSPLFYKPDHFV